MSGKVLQQEPVAREVIRVQIVGGRWAGMHLALDIEVESPTQFRVLPAGFAQMTPRVKGGAG